METLDANLLKRFQKIADVVQLWIGLTNFQLAKITLSIALMCWLESKIEETIWHGWSTFGIMGMIVGMIFYLFITYRIKIGEKNCHQNPLFQSDLAIDFALFRRFSICFVFFTTFSLIGVIFFGGTKDGKVGEAAHEFRIVIFTWIASVTEWLTFYLASCTPKPRTPSRLKEWLEKTNLKTQTQKA